MVYYGGGGFTIAMERFSPAKRRFFGELLTKTKTDELKAQRAAADRAKAGK